jgi:hypothetical protein
MAPSNRRNRKLQEAGFSMVEMLMAAFVLSVGILGVSMLQIMSLQSTRGSQSLNTASQLADQIMDQIELEGRLTMLNHSTSASLAPPAVPGLKYIGLNPPPEQFNVLGTAVVPLSTDIKLKNPFFTVSVAQNPVAAGAVGVAEDATIDVLWTDTFDTTHTAIPRHVILTRRILHG